jgi:hypothetical protein
MDIKDRKVEIVLKLMEQDGIARILMIPGIWEILSEYYNNYIVDELTTHNE